MPVSLTHEDALRILRSLALALHPDQPCPLQRDQALAEAARCFFDLCAQVTQDQLLAQPTLEDWAALLHMRWLTSARRLCFQTSGSTGVPSLHCYPYAMLEEEARVLAPYFTGIKRVVSVMPVHHIFGHIYTLVLPKVLGIPALHLPPLPVAGFFTSLRAGDLIVAFPYFWQSVLNLTRYESRDHAFMLPPHVRGATATAPCPPEVIRDLLNLSALSQGRQPSLAGMSEIYGSTEAPSIGIRQDGSTWYTLTPLWHRVDTDGTPALARIRKDGTALPPQPLPDVITWKDERQFVPQQRVDKAVQVGGINVYPDRIAAVIREHPQVRACSVRLMRPEEGVRLKVFIVPDKPIDASVRHDFGKPFRAWMAERLDTASRPKAVTLGDSLPVNAMGKACDWDLS